MILYCSQKVTGRYQILLQRYYYKKVIEFMKVSLDKQLDDINDEFYVFKVNEYKKDKCKSKKLITINIDRVCLDKIIYVDMVNAAEFELDGGRYMRFFSINSSDNYVLDLLREIYKYKGHMVGATEEEKRKYIALTNSKND